EVLGVDAAAGMPSPEGAEQESYSRDLTGPTASPSRGSSSPRKVLLATFATGPVFEETQLRLHESLGTAEIQEHWAWNKTTFDEGVHGDWYRRNAKVNFRRGGAWKPYLIWQSFRHVKWGDWLIYHDASQYVREGFSSSVQPLLDWLESKREENPCECLAATRLRQTIQHEWQQQCVGAYGPVERDFARAEQIHCGTMWRLGACTPSSRADCCAHLWRRPMMQHSWSVWRKNRRSARFLREWAKQSEEFDIVAHLPFVDQSLNSLLFYRWHEELQLKALWVPSLYRAHWAQDMDLSAVGRWDGVLLKHMNSVLDELYNEAITRKQKLWLTNPVEEQHTEGSEAAPESRGLTWCQSRAQPKRWARSLCIPDANRPALAARVVAAILYLSDGAGNEVPLSGRYKSPSGWNRDEYEPSRSNDPVGDLSIALLGPPKDGASHFGGGEPQLFAQGFAGALQLGQIRTPVPDIIGPDGVEFTPRRVLAEVTLLNDGSVPWPPGARLCPALGGGNFTRPEANFECFHEGQFGQQLSCGALKKGQLAVVRIATRLPGSELRGALRESRWALCDPETEKPFGVFFSLQFHPGVAP
ncbi:unnamed protein product, partial [Polarella glacialis]